MSDPDETPPNGFDARGAVQLLRDKATVPDDAPTGEYCPCCATYDERGVMTPGDGVVRKIDDAGTYRTSQCQLCKGSTWCSASEATNWRIRNIASGKR